MALISSFSESFLIIFSKISKSPKRYLAKSITSRSLPEIGRKFGGRDHTTVMHAVKKIEELKLSDVNFNEDLELLKRLIDS